LVRFRSPPNWTSTVTFGPHSLSPLSCVLIFIEAPPVKLIKNTETGVVRVKIFHQTMILKHQGLEQQRALQ